MRRPVLYGMVTTAASTDYAEVAVESFLRHTPLLPGDRFFLIDNDNRSWHKWQPFSVNVIHNPKPLGFAANVNQAIRAADGADVVFLNNDLVFTPGWADPLLTADNRLVAPLTNAHLPAYGWPYPCTLADYRGTEGNLDEAATLHQGAGSGYSSVTRLQFYCVRIPAAVYREVGLLDESFGPAGGEDFDYCLRCHRAGVPVGHALSSFVLHFGGRSSWRGPETKQQAEARDATYIERFEEKWGPAAADWLMRGNTDRIRRDPNAWSAYRRGDFGPAARLLTVEEDQ